VAEFGRLDIVIANAGIAAPAPTLEMSEESWSTMIDVNLTGVWKTLKASVPHVLAGERGGSVVLISSLAAMTANLNIAHYSAAKAGLVGLMRVLAKELGPANVRVNSIHPGFIDTDMVFNESKYRLFRPDLEHPTRSDMEELTRTRHALPFAAGAPLDVSNAVLYLVSDDGRYITGTTHIVDGGGAL
jgi:(+)-trans-carveol dehydrogenase